MAPGSRCCVVDCNSASHNRRGKKGDGLRFFRIPKVKKTEGKHVEEVTTRRRMAWIAAIRRTTITFERYADGIRVCSRHFHGGAPAYEMLENHPDWAPSLHLGHDAKLSKSRKSMNDRAMLRQKFGIDIKVESDESAEENTESPEVPGVRRTKSSVSKKIPSNKKTATNRSKTCVKKGMSGVRKQSSKARGDMCCVSGCHNGRNKKSTAGRSYFFFPRAESRCATWLKNMGRQDLQGKSPSQLRSDGFKICSDHFEADQFSSVGETRTLTRNAIPSLFKTAKRRVQQRESYRKRQLIKGKQSKRKDQMAVPEVKLEIDFADDPLLFCGVQGFPPPEATSEDRDPSERGPDSADHPLYIKPETVWENEETASTSYTVTASDILTKLDHKTFCSLRSAADNPKDEFLSRVCDSETSTHAVECVKLEPVVEEDERFVWDDGRKAAIGKGGETHNSEQVNKARNSVRCTETELAIKQEPLDCEEPNPDTSEPPQLLLNRPVKTEMDRNTPTSMITHWDGKEHIDARNRTDCDIDDSFVSTEGVYDGKAGEEIVMVPRAGGDEYMVAKIEPEPDMDELQNALNHS